jgi:hypothetical protein
MANATLGRRAVLGHLRLALMTAAVVAAGPLAWTAGSAWPAPSAPRDPAARRRWALARMDEMAHERLRCRERFRHPRQVRECEADFERRHRAYNEVYLEAAREEAARE